MKFLSLFANSAVGSTLAVWAYTVAVSLFYAGALPAVSLLLQLAYHPLVFSLVFSFCHSWRRPTMFSSFALAVVYVALMSLDIFTGFTFSSVVTGLGVAVLLSTGAFIGSRFGR